MATLPHTILLKGRGIWKEAVANAAITPGDLVEMMSTGKIRKHATAGGLAIRAFAFENEMLGKEITVDYPAGDQVYYVEPMTGSWVYALVASSASAIVIGDPLESDGTGGVRKSTVGATTLTEAVVGIAMEALDNSAGASRARLKIEVM